MLLPRWLDDELHGRGWVIVSAVVLVGVVIAWLVWAAFDAPVKPAASAPVVMAAPPVPVPPLAAEPASAPVVVAAELPTCPHQHLDIAETGGTQRGCVSATRTRQTGSIRTFVVEPEGVSAWQLSVDMAGGDLLSVRLQRSAVGTSQAQLFVCDGRECQGASLGPADGQGARLLTLADTALRALPPGQVWKRRLPGVKQPKAALAPTTASLPLVRLSATLKTEPDRNQTLLACRASVVHIVESTGSVVEFCALGGAGFELADDGLFRFSFRDLEGRNLSVSVGKDGSIASVSLGALSCKAPACGAIAMNTNGDVADPEVERSFAFSGTTLRSAQPGTATASLNGGVTMPSQQ